MKISYLTEAKGNLDSINKRQQSIFLLFYFLIKEEKKNITLCYIIYY